MRVRPRLFRNVRPNTFNARASSRARLLAEPRALALGSLLVVVLLVGSIVFGADSVLQTSSDAKLFSGHARKHCGRLCQKRQQKSKSSKPAPSNVQWVGTYELIETKLDTIGDVSGTPSQFTRVIADGTGQATVSVPMSSSGLKRLSKGSKPTVSNGNAHFSMSLNGATRQTVTSDFPHSSLPVAVSVSYKLNGKPISASDLLGKAGTVKVTVVLTNLTAHETTVSFLGFNGVQQHITLLVPQPVIAEINTIVPENATRISAPGGALYTTHSGIEAEWNTALFEPQKLSQSFSYQMYTPSASIGQTIMLLKVPIVTQTPSGKATEESARAVGAAEAATTASLAAINSDLAKLHNHQSSRGRHKRRSLDINHHSRNRSLTAVMQSLNAKLQDDITHLKQSAAVVKAAVAHIQTLAASLKGKADLRDKAAAALSNAAANLETLTANLVARANQDLAAATALRVQIDTIVADLTAFPSSITSLPEFAKLQADVTAAHNMAVAAEARATEAITQAQAMDAAARELADHAASLAAGIHELAVLAAKLKLATVAASFLRALDDLVSSLVPGSNARSTAVSPGAQASSATAAGTTTSAAPPTVTATAVASAATAGNRVTATMARKSVSALSDQIKSRVAAAQAELTAAEAKIHEAEIATEQKLQAKTQAEIAALQAKAASSLAAAQADFNKANMTYAQILALDKVAMAHQMPGGDATFLDSDGKQKRVESQTGLYRYVVSGASPPKHPKLHHLVHP